MSKYDEEHRNFPRFPTQCPVFFHSDALDEWQVGMLTNMSATGLQMTSKSCLPENSKIQIMLKQGSDKMVPEISGDGTVVRCIKNGNRTFNVSVTLTHIDLPKHEQI